MSDPLPCLPGTVEPGSTVRLAIFDFDGVFTDNTVWTDDQGRESVRCWRSDGLGLKKLRDLSIPVWVLSTETSLVVTKRCAKLEIPCRHGLERKENALMELATQLNIPLQHVLYLGNDINDAGCLGLVGLPIVVRDAHEDVLSQARFQTRMAGGFGAVREVCDWIHASVTTARKEK